jgi:hypothetical protein
VAGGEGRTGSDRLDDVDGAEVVPAHLLLEHAHVLLPPMPQSRGTDVINSCTP